MERLQKTLRLKGLVPLLYVKSCIFLQLHHSFQSISLKMASYVCLSSWVDPCLWWPSSILNNFRMIHFFQSV